MTGVRYRPTATGRGAAVRTVISSWSAVSPFGLDRADFVAGLRDGRRCVVPIDRDRWAAPVEDACLVPGFDARRVLGSKGTRVMDRATALAVATAGQLFRDRDGGRIDGVGADTALVLGTSTGSTQSMMDFIRNSLVRDKPYFVDPACFPYTAMNCAAAQTAIWHQLRGPNTTIAGGRASGLLALNYALRLRRSGRAGVVACGAVEEFSAARAWLEHHSTDRRPGPALGEGCAMVLLEPAGRPGEHGRTELAEVLALEFGVYREQTDIRPALAGCLRRAFAAAHESPDRVWAVATSGGSEPAGTAEGAALAEVGVGAPVRLLGTDLVGDTNAASAMFGLAAVLTLAARVPAKRTPTALARTALLTSVDRDGIVGCALLRLATGTADLPPATGEPALGMGQRV